MQVLHPARAAPMLELRLMMSAIRFFVIWSRCKPSALQASVAEHRLDNFLGPARPNEEWPPTFPNISGDFISPNYLLPRSSS